MQRHGGPVALIIDNAPCHSRVEEEINAEEDLRDCVVVRLSPYSPMFNPIEQVWSFFKSQVKRDLSNKLTEILALPAMPSLSVTEQRNC